MKTEGIRILDTKDGFVSVFLSDILDEIEGAHFFWSILFFDGMGDLRKQNITALELMEISHKSQEGFFISWSNLNELASLFWEIIDIVIVGNKEARALHQYEDDEKMYRSCDVVIVKFDSCYWEVFSKHPELIQKLAGKFNKTIPLKPDFQNEWLKNEKV